MPPSDLMVDDALDALIHQFADPLACLRELVQNAIDAGSPEVEIRVEHEAGARQGLDAVTLVVEDVGEGMDRRLVDERLTRLFSSSKTDDLTKIGRFGIGFVSVFALEPEAVCLDTSRAGENWRILFRGDRTFERIVLEQPVDGTRIRIFLTLPPGEVADFVARAREAARFWCRHAAAEVRFDGVPVNEPFGVEALCTVHHAEQGTEVVAGFCPEPTGRYGFYNRGLTLLEGPGDSADLQKVFFPHVAFKVDSRYLEHTLARDTVRRDANFDKAMAIVRRLVERELPSRLFQVLANPEPGRSSERWDALYGAVATWLRRQRKISLDDRVAPAVAELGDQRIFQSPAGMPVSVTACIAADREGRLYYDPEPSPLVDQLEATGAVVIGCAHRSPAYGALREICGNRPQRANASFCTALPTSELSSRAFAPLAPRLRRLLGAAGVRTGAIRLAHLAYPGSSVAGRVAISQRRFGELTEINRAGALATSIFQRRRLFVVNADHPALADLLRLAGREPELAAYVVAKLFFLSLDLSPELDATLAARAVQSRCRRANT